MAEALVINLKHLNIIISLSLSLILIKFSLNYIVCQALSQTHSLPTLPFPLSRMLTRNSVSLYMHCPLVMLIIILQGELICFQGRQLCQRYLLSFCVNIQVAGKWILMRGEQEKHQMDWLCSVESVHEQERYWVCTWIRMLLSMFMYRNVVESLLEQKRYWGCSWTGMLLSMFMYRNVVESLLEQKRYWGCSWTGMLLSMFMYRNVVESLLEQKRYWGCSWTGMLLSMFM